MRAGFVFISDAAVSISLFALALGLLHVAWQPAAHGNGMGTFASDILQMEQSGATAQELGWAFRSNFMCGGIERFSKGGISGQVWLADCDCSGARGSEDSYSLAGMASAGFSKVTVCRK